MLNEIELKRLAWEIRKAIIYEISSKGGGHVGGTLDLAELMAVLYGAVMNVRPEDPSWPQRDNLVCSKGHSGPAIYAALALKGFFPYEKLSTLNCANTTLPGHCDRRVPGIDATTGSLGQGLSIACGLALGARMSGYDKNVFCILGDGELDEGQNWEAALFAAHHKLDQLIAFLDWNKKQIDGTNDAVMSLGDIQAKFRSFGWHVQMVDGRDIPGIYHAIEEARSTQGQPSIVILDTVKGAGIPCIEQIADNHCIGVPRDLAERAFTELDEEARMMGGEDR